MEETTKKHIIDVVPLTRIPLTRNQSFSYLYDTKLPVGTLVWVPLFRRKVEGIVLGSRDDFERLGNIELKKIDKVIEENFLTGAQIKLAKFISDYYISPLGIVMKNFVPKRIRMRSSSYLVSSILYKKKKIQLSPEQKKAVETISDTKYQILNTKYLLFGPAGSGKTEVYIHSILKLQKKNPNLQALILVPEQTLTPQAIERYGAYFGPSEVVVMSSNIPKGQYWTNWLKIKSGEAKIVIGTRMACFAPFQKLGLIVIDEEQDMSYKNWDMNPRYDARTVAEKLSELHNCSLVRGSATPGIISYYRALNNELRLLKLPALNLEVSGISYLVSSKKNEIPNTEYQIPDTILVDMKKERWQKNYSPISKKLKSEIQYILKHKMQAMLLINRQGMSNFSVCEKCKTVLRCPKCDRALSYDKEGHYRCLQCSYRTSITPSCPKCKGIVFRNVGLGTQKVEKELEYLFPSAHIARLDSQAIRVAGTQEKIYNDFKERKIDILVGTQMISKGWDLPHVALVSIIDADNLFSIPDYFSNERAYDLISQMAGRTSRPGSKMKGTVLIQTFHPENKMLKWIAEGDFASYFEEEMKERKALKLPPFGSLVKLIFQDGSLKKVESASNDVHELLQKSSSVISFTEPIDPFLPKIRGRYRKQIIVKLKGEKMPAKTLKILKALPSGWIVDVDPISIT